MGISIGLTRLFYVLDEQGLLNPDLPASPADALVLPMTADPGPAIALAEALRSRGLRVQLYCEQRKFRQKLNYADKLGVPFAVLLGEDEIAANVCSVKHMISGEQRRLSVEEAAAWIREEANTDCPMILEK